MAKCGYCIYYRNGRCTDKHGVKFNSLVDPVENIECPAFIGAGYICFERRTEAVTT